MKTENIRKNIGNNITYLRKQKNLTQLELASRLNYSDKAISKWERSESLPDVVTLYEIALFFDVTINELIETNLSKRKTLKSVYYLLAIVNASLALVFILLYSFYQVITSKGDAWMVFIYFIPVSTLTSYILSNGLKRIYRLILISLFIWSLALVMFLLITFNYNYLWFIIAIPVQVLLLLIYLNKRLY